MAFTKTTASSRKHAFVSFREKIDAIKIEPSLNLTKRAHDYVETSHTLAIFEHWREINLSGTFVEFADQFEPLIQTLPQILYHQERIYALLNEYIAKNDALALHPLFEILAQFVHDLGPDFMRYYEKTLELMKTTVLTTANNSESLEWAFTCLAFVFKYMSRELSKDLVPTFDVLLPILQLNKREYVSRFCAEAMSFLVRKTNEANLTKLVEKSFNSELNLTPAYGNSLVIMYSESMKNTRGTFHSRYPLIMTSLFDHILIRNQNAQFCSVLCDILLRVVNHGSIDACKAIYSYLNTKIASLLDQNNSVAVTQVLIAAVFADSGKKVSDWSELIEIVEKLVEVVKQHHNAPLVDSIGYLFSLIMRNCALNELTKFHISMFKTLSILNGGSEFLPFIETCFDLTKDRTLSFGAKYIQEFISNQWRSFDVKIALFLIDLQKKNILNSSQLNIIIPHDFYQSLLDSIDTFEIVSEASLREIYWKLVVLSHTQGVQNSDGLMRLFVELTNENFVFDGKFSRDLVAVILDSLSAQDLQETTAETITNIIFARFEDLKSSTDFVVSVNKFIKNNSTIVKRKLEEKPLFDGLCSSVIANLSLPHHETRLGAIELLITILETTDMAVSDIITQARLIEQSPLSLQNGRDIQLRVRNISSNFINVTIQNKLVTSFLSNYIVGLLTMKFSPVWEVVYEILPNIIGKCSVQIWELVYQLIVKDYNNQEQVDDVMEDIIDSTDLNLSQWMASDARLVGNFEASNVIYTKYRDDGSSIVEYVNEKRPNNSYSDLIRSQMIKVLKTVPSLAERNSQLLTPLVLKEGIEAKETHSNHWSVKDRNLLIELFTKFNNLPKMGRSQEVYEYMLDLLCNRSVPIQKLALDCIINWKNPRVNRYKDNLRNLLDDTVFRDEISKFITKSTTNIIEDEDKVDLMPLILRILFGRAQTPKTSSMKQGRKYAVITILPNLAEEDIIKFIQLGISRIGFSSLEEIPQSVDSRQLRRINGFVNLLSEIYSTLGYNFIDVLATTVEPLIYSICVSQKLISNEQTGDAEEDEEESDETTTPDFALSKAARIVRTLGMKTLNSLFVILGDKFDWSPYVSQIHSKIISPRLENYAHENLEPSSLLKMMVGWIDIASNHKFYYVDDFASSKAILSLLSNEHIKESVISIVLDFAIKVITTKSASENDQMIYMIALVVETSLNVLARLFNKMSNHETSSKAVTLLLELVNNDFITDNETRASLIASLTEAVENNSVSTQDKAKILTILASLVADFDCSLNEVTALYKACSRAFKTYSDRGVRESLVRVFQSFGEKFDEFSQIGSLVADLNAYSTERMREPDFEKRLDAFKIINEDIYLKLSPLQWLPLIYNGLYFINDEAELALRTNGCYLLRRFIDCYSAIEEEDSDRLRQLLHMLKDIILPLVRLGIRRKENGDENVHTEYILLVAHLVEFSKHYVELGDMKVLLHNGDNEANFFLNVNHIQIHRRQRAIARLRDYHGVFSDHSVAHYLIPIIEHYCFDHDEKVRNVGNEAIETIGSLATYMNWNQYKALFKRYISFLRVKKESFRDAVNLIVVISAALLRSVEARKDKESGGFIIKQLPVDSLDSILLNEFVPQMLKALTARDEDTGTTRVPLSEGLTSLVMCLSDEHITIELPAILTNVAQIMKSRSEELRDAVRKTLGRIATILGPKYLKFILQELKGALKKGAQIHVLSFTAHSVITSISPILVHGDLDESAELIVDIVMEDVFGTAGQEKEADGYNTKMKEVKHNKSFDTAELLAANISLKTFQSLISPVKSLLKERIALKIQNKLDELLRRYALGLNHNSEAGSREVLILCFELHQQSIEILKDDNPKKNENSDASIQDHFLVKLSARPLKTQMEYSLYIFTLQKFAFELLKTAVSRHDSLLTVANLQGFLPLLEHSLRSDNEPIIVSCFRVLTLFTKLTFPEDTEELIFKTCARRALVIIKDSPTTASELCQSSLKFLATIIRHKSHIEIKPSAISYVLVKLQPDLEEPHRQGLAFNFLKAVVSQHIMVPEVYDTMDKVSKIMITNHSKEIRDMSRSVYYQFLMEYDQGRGRLEKQFKFLVDNLDYPAQAGRQSVMELIHLILMKSGQELLIKLAASFFVALANVVISDDATRCRDMAVSLIGGIFKKLENVESLEKYILAWLAQKSNPLLLRCGLQVYKIYINERGLENTSDEMNSLALSRVKEILVSSKTDGGAESAEWEAVYTALTVFAAMNTKRKQQEKENWSLIMDCILYPHSWVRLAASRLIGGLLSNIEDFSFEISDYELQTIAHRTFHQLKAPGITEQLGTQIVTILTTISMKWEKNNSKYVQNEENEENDEEPEKERTVKKFVYALDWSAYRIGIVMRNETAKDSDVSKKSAIQYAGMLIQILSKEKLMESAEGLLLSLFNFLEDESYDGTELRDLATECQDLLQKKLGTTDFGRIQTRVNQAVNRRRYERRSKRAQWAISAPEYSAKRKLKKHERSRDKRKHEKDENGYYHSKKKVRR